MQATGARLRQRAVRTRFRFEGGEPEEPKTGGRDGAASRKNVQPMKTKFVAPILWLSILSVGHGMTLDAVLNKTLENNPEIQRAKANLEAARGRRIVLRSGAWPNVKRKRPAGGERRDWGPPAQGKA